MDKKSTLKNLMQFTQNEKQLLNDVGLESSDDLKGPRKLVIDNILNYSKIYSVRKSKELGFIESLLN